MNRQTKAMKECYEKMKKNNPELLSLAEEMHKVKSKQWIGYFVCIGLIRNLIHNKEEVLDTIKALSFGMDSYNRALDNYELLLNELDELNDK